LDGHAKQVGKPFDWTKVYALRTSTKISNRIQFLLQDLLDLKQAGKKEEEQRGNVKILYCRE
jgi:hypothetical protein